MMKYLWLLLILYSFSFADCFADLQCSVSLSKPQKRYARIEAFDTKGNKHLQFGFESEYTLKDSEKLLRAYMPDPNHVNMSRSEWLSFSHQERLEYLEKHSKVLFPSVRLEGLMVKISKNESLPFSFLKDGHNYEIRLDPIDTYEDWYRTVTSINEELGVGSMQAVISFPSRSFLHAAGKTSNQLGYLNFINEMDTLEKLFRGAQRYKKNPNLLVAQSFNHLHLGPMNTTRHKHLVKVLDDLSIDPHFALPKTTPPYKYIGGTSFRPDIAQGIERMALETRDCHKDFELLNSRLSRSTELAQRDLSMFSKAQGFSIFDTKADLKKLSPEVRETLKKIFPYKFDNFAYPLKDWKVQVEFIGKGQSLKQVQKAQTAYVEKLENISDLLNREMVSIEQAQKEVQGSIAQFSEESNLYRWFSEWFEKETGLRPAL